MPTIMPTIVMPTIVMPTTIVPINNYANDANNTANNNANNNNIDTVSYTHLTLPTTPYV